MTPPSKDDKPPGAKGLLRKEAWKLHATDEELTKAIAGYRDLRFAELFTIWLGLAAEEYPDELRRSLAQVFDLSAVDYQCQRVSGMLVELLQQLADAKSELRDLHAKCERLDKWLNGLEPRPGGSNGAATTTPRIAALEESIRQQQEAMGINIKK